VTTREEFLSHLRNKAPTPANLPHPFVPVAEMPAVQYVRELSDPRRAFTEAATRVGATVREVDDLARLLADVVREYDVHTAVVSADPETADVPDALQRLDVQVVERGAHSAKRADLGITGAAWGVAATGSLILDAARAGGRTSGLVPPVHLALLRVDRIVPHAGSLWRHLPEMLPDGLPSNLVFATGPSRSGDIEMVITVGVHGPKAVIIGLIS
jgi:L-lactate dehydrogenase complex protein LldG